MEAGLTKKMKIGILTFHHTTNYGATLQTYALYTTLKSWNHQVEIIDYRPAKAAREYRNGIKPINKKLQVNPHATNNFLRYLKMRVFLLSHIKLSKNKTYIKEGLRKIRQDYDVVICGSDQVWCIDSPIRGFDTSYFLDFVPSQATRKISYAASFGQTDYLGKHQEAIEGLIQSFSAISVRDSNSLSLIQSLDKPAVKVLDPTFLINYDDIKSVPKEQEYLLIYYHGNLSDQEKQFVRAIAELKKIKIVSIWSSHDVASKNILSVGPREWLGYFSKASYVVTNFYHGTIFSIIFEKLFTVLICQEKANKIGDLLKSLELCDRTLSGVIKPETIYQQSLLHLKECDRTLSGVIKPETIYQQSLAIDYVTVNRKLKSEILASQNYLLEALEGKSEYLSNKYELVK